MVFEYHFMCNTYVHSIPQILSALKSRQKPYYFSANWLSHTAAGEDRSESFLGSKNIEINFTHIHALGMSYNVNDRQIELRI